MGRGGKNCLRGEDSGEAVLARVVVEHRRMRHAVKSDIAVGSNDSTEGFLVCNK